MAILGQKLGDTGYEPSGNTVSNCQQNVCNKMTGMVTVFNYSSQLHRKCTEYTVWNVMEAKVIERVFPLDDFDGGRPPKLRQIRTNRSREKYFRPIKTMKDISVIPLISLMNT